MGSTLTLVRQIVIGDPSYFPDKVKKVGRVARIICILGAPIPNTNNSESCQIIIPASQVPGRKSDIYISLVSSAHNVVPKGKFVAIVGADLETDAPVKVHCFCSLVCANLLTRTCSLVFQEFTPALKLLGPVLENFIIVTDSFEPVDDGKKSGVFITKSYDSTSHFGTSTQDVMQVYERITGSPPDLTPKAPVAEETPQ